MPNVRKVALLAVLGLAATVGGGTGLGLELTRGPTAGEVRAAGESELSTRWRRLRAEEIFPATVPYAELARDDTMTSTGLPDNDRLARRVGIGDPVPCAAAFDKPVADNLTRLGCRTVARATYVDSSGTLVATAGLTVLPTKDVARAAEGEFGVTPRRGLRALAFPGTVAAGFTDDRRQKIWMQSKPGTPYVFFYAAGWLDGRGRVDDGRRIEEFMLAERIIAAMSGRFGPVEQPCKAKGVRC